MRVFIGFADVAGFASRLGSLLAKAGHEVSWINTAPNCLNPAGAERERLHEIAPGLFRLSKRLKERCYPLYVICNPLIYMGKLGAYWWALGRSEVMVFLGCGMLLPGYLDRRLAKWCGRRTVNVYLGSASRPVVIGGSGVGMAEMSEKKLRKLAKKLRRQRRRVRKIAAICDEIVENPLCSQFQPRKCVDWFRIGFPGGAELFQVTEGVGQGVQGERVTILHCPSKPRVKGTDRIRTLMDALKGEGLPIEYVEITGMPHSEVLNRLAQCDFVIDELYSDSPLAGFASEAAHFSKPAVVGGYGWEILRSLPSAEWMAPSATCRPEELERTVRELIQDAAKRGEMGARAKRYSDEFLGVPGYVERFEKVLSGDMPEDWRFDPEGVEYFHGFGQREPDLRRGLERFVERFGMSALCLDHRPGLRAAVARFLAGAV